MDAAYNAAALTPAPSFEQSKKLSHAENAGQLLFFIFNFK
jgi:hypothetical protein